MPVLKHLYVLNHGRTYGRGGILTVTLPVGVCIHVLDSYMGRKGATGGGDVSMHGLCNRSGFMGGSKITTRRLVIYIQNYLSWNSVHN